MDKSFDTAVVMLFFIRDDTFAQVFEAVRQAKPKKLYLFQDGARPDRPDDMEKMLRCRKICENIDWECEVHRNYQEKNLGCDPSEFAAISWAFEHEEQIIYLEDDDVPSQSFFYFCDELLNKYRDDKDVFMICGRNQLGETNYDDNSYFFAQADSIWGWASWRDRWALCDYKHEFLNDPEKVKKVKNQAPTRYDGKKFIERCRLHRSKATDTYVPSYESPIRAAIYLHDKVSIIPRINLVKNVGITGDSVHTSAGLNNIPKNQRNLYTIGANEIEFPLKHPDSKTPNKKFLVERLKLMGSSSAIRHFFHRVEGYLLRKF
ncbi:MAG: hemolysin activation protein [Clostridia bacterium]|nr:hemolysin activation protein [Clostridia bacterium]